MSDRYTPEQMRAMAADHDEELNEMTAAMLRQAAADAETLEEFWREVERGFNIEPRAHFEAEAPKIGFSSPVAMALHHIWKRDPRVSEALAAKDTEIARLTGEVAAMRLALAEEHGYTRLAQFALAAERQKVREFATRLRSAVNADNLNWAADVVGEMERHQAEGRLTG